VQKFKSRLQQEISTFTIIIIIIIIVIIII